MNTFLSVFLFFYIIYGTAHLYAFLKIKYTFHLDTSASVFLGLFLVFTTFSPSFIRLCSSKSSGRLLSAFAYISYTWMALLFFFSSTAIIFDIYNFIVPIIGSIIQKDANFIKVPSMLAFYMPIFLAVPLSIYSYFEAKRLQVKRLTIKTPKLTKEIDKLKIAHISDLHLGIMVKDEILDKVITEVEKEIPDLIVLSGDFLEEETTHIDYLSAKLKRLNAKLGKFAVTGNHDFFGGIEHSLKFIKDAGFKTLRGEGITIQGLINIAGVDDPISKNLKDVASHPSENEILSNLPSNIFTILLKHRPNTNKNSLGLFDLQLSGHTHGGQIFPVSLVVMLFLRHNAGYKKLAKGSAIYVSRGAGTVCSPIRFLAQPEITIIEVVSIKETQKSNFKNQN